MRNSCGSLNMTTGFWLMKRCFIWTMLRTKNIIWVAFGNTRNRIGQGTAIFRRAAVFVQLRHCWMQKFFMGDLSKNVGKMWDFSDRRDSRGNMAGTVWRRFAESGTGIANRRTVRGIFAVELRVSFQWNLFVHAGYASFGVPRKRLTAEAEKFSESRKVTCRLFLHHWNYESVSVGRANSSSYAALGKYLFSALQKQYEKSQFNPETYSIGCFCLWHYLPEAVKEKEPFSTLCRVKTYWDRNDTQAWKLLQQAFAFYDSGNTA